MKRFLLILIVLTAHAPLFAQVILPRLIRDSMILQRDQQVNLWGWASPGEKITVNFNGKKYRLKADEAGNWKMQIPATKAGGPYTIDIIASNKIIIKNILFGDVWFCSGQSNMVHQMELHKYRYATDISEANYPGIRQFWIPTLTNLQQPAKDIPTGYWKSANPKDVLQFSAVAYFFAKKLYDQYQIPIGLINASVGGSPIEAWMSEEGLKQFPATEKIITKNKDTAYVNETNRKAFAFNNAMKLKPEEDKGLTGEKKWYDPTYIPKEWRSINIPGYWEDQGIKNLDGVVWYRKEIEVPESMTNIPATIFMGRIVDADHLYINGKPAGNTTYMYPQRRYQLKASLLKPGKNLIVFRVINYHGKGGFVPDKPYCLFAAKDTIDLKGNWQYKVGEVFTEQKTPQSISLQNQPTALYNAMAAPFTNSTVKGILWYQGESNTGNANEYTKLLPALIKDWRNQWKQGDIPFIYVQLPNFMETDYLPSESQSAELREAQLKTLSVPNTAMAVAIDLGEWNDIHPDNKRDVGERLALAALQTVYHENIVGSGPVFTSAHIEKDSIILSFSNTGSGLINIDGEELSEFAIAGADKKFVWAKARIEGDKVVVWNDEISNPLYVRYAWADNPVNPNLYNKEGLPASPFRTDGD